MINHPNRSKSRRFVAYYWPKPDGHINCFDTTTLEAAREWETQARAEAALIWNQDTAYDRAARGNYPRVIALVSYPLGMAIPARSAPNAERIEWEESEGALDASGAGWHISRPGR